EELGFIPLITQSDPSFESLLDNGVHQGWYDVDNTLQLMILQWIFIPWLHAELDAYCDHILPHGVLELVFSSPQDYGALDLMFMVDKAALKHVHQLYINTGHLVFDLVPCPLHVLLEECYNDLGHPTVTCLTIWHIYLDLLHAVQDHALHSDLPTSPADTDADDNLPLLKGQCDLPFNDNDDGYYYMGGVGGGLGPPWMGQCDK
ncbi:hypothetical protein F5141DRAFT_1065751, partial [Pisolithus sp. B1]